MGILKSASYTVLTQIPTQILGIISGVFITRMLGPEGRGLYAIFYADIALFSTILGFSINTAITHFKAKETFSEKTLLSVSVLFSLVTVALSLLLLTIWINLPFSDVLFPSEHLTPAYILLFILFIVLGQINTVYAALFQGALRFDVVNKVSLFNSVFNLLLFGMAFLAHNMAWINIGIEEILGLAALILLLNFFQWHRHYNKSFSYKMNLRLKWKSEIQPFFAFMGLGHLSNVINFFNYRLVLWVMAYYLDNGQIGIFSLGAGLAQLINFISNPLAQVLMPFLSAESDEQRLGLFSKFARIHFTLVLGLGLIGILIAVPLIPVVYGAEFKDSGKVFYLIMTGVLFSTQTKQVAGFFISSDKIKLNLYATIVGFTLTFGFNIWLVRDYGIYGAAVAQSITYLGIFLFVYAAMLKFTQFQVKNIFIINRSDINYARKRLKQKAGRN
jgi:O-antigen/teichoic acid export membrane protein